MPSHPLAQLKTPLSLSFVTLVLVDIELVSDDVMEGLPVVVIVFSLLDMPLCSPPVVLLVMLLTFMTNAAGLAAGGVVNLAF